MFISLLAIFTIEVVVLYKEHYLGEYATQYLLELFYKHLSNVDMLRLGINPLLYIYISFPIHLKEIRVIFVLVVSMLMNLPFEDIIGMQYFFIIFFNRSLISNTRFITL